MPSSHADGKVRLNAAVDAAREAFPSWSQSLPAERQATLRAGLAAEREQGQAGGRQGDNGTFCGIKHGNAAFRQTR